MPGIGTTTRSSRWGASKTMSSRTRSSRREALYWRLMKNMIETRIGIRRITSYAPSRNFTEVTTIATIPVSTAPTALIMIR